ncbi:hypothetical protein DFQ27_009127 [Actinomortierella ambigua]|uniref:Uncharacterized protein n=1 Tax=Actinomortierella ambigua TaxID=1343610 RepID=A0A9P6TY30_9FUNG|nr:hypothetical protein DFQ27_009127 [Actinomortierella ambigua]
MSYHLIADRSNSRNVSSILQGIINGNISVSPADRKSVIDALLCDLKESGVANSWSERDRNLAIEALKTLGRAPEGCDSMFSTEGIKTLMYQSGLTPASANCLDSTGSKEALKCLANALLLKPAAREIFETLEGHCVCSSHLKDRSWSNETQFLLCRVLLLVTINSTSVVQDILDKHDGVEGVGTVLKTQLARSPDGTMFTQSMVLSEALKYVFNLMMVDPKITRKGETYSTDEEKAEASGKRFQSLTPTLASILTTVPQNKTTPLSPPHSHAIHVLFNCPVAGAALLLTRSQQALLLQVLVQMLEDTLKYHLNTDEEASTDGLSSGTDLDESIPPLVLVLTNIASAGEEARAAMKARMLPDNVDRSAPLDKGNRFSARLIRRMTSVRYPYIRETVSNLLFVICNEDPNEFTLNVGYGNAAGFLLNRGLGMPSMMGGSGDSEDSSAAATADSAQLPQPPSSSSASRSEVAPWEEPGTPTKEDGGGAGTSVANSTTPPPSSTTASTSIASSSSSSPSRPQDRRRPSQAQGPTVNPITGAFYPDPSAIRTAMSEMTEEEKEAEAGRLLDMIDKMRRTGVIEMKNPALEAALRHRERDQYWEEVERREAEEAKDDE